MNNDIPQYQDAGYTESGYLVIRATTASEALPLENATVTVYGELPDFSAVIVQTETGPDGLTPKLELLTPPRSLSETPDSARRPYASYRISVDREGYYPITLQGVPVFSGITSVQPADLIPLMENGYPDSFSPFGGTVTEREPSDL